MKKFVRRKAVIAAGLIIALTGLTYLSTWVVGGDQRIALRCAIAVLCFLLAFAATFYAVGELSRD